MTRQVVQCGSLTVTALVGPNRAQMLEIDLPGEQTRLNRQEAKRVAEAILRWFGQTDPWRRRPL